MYNGTFKKAQNVKLNDLLMGDDYTPRRVGALFRGESDLYEIDVNGNKFTVNGYHRLAFKEYFWG